MKRYYFVYFSLGVVAIFLLQAMNIYSLYNNFLTIERQKVEDATYEAIGLELHHRQVMLNTPDSNVLYTRTVISDTEAYALSKFPKELKDAVLKHLATISKPKHKEYSIPKLMDDGVIRSAGDFDLQNTQDIFMKKGEFINVENFDSLFNIRLGRGYSNRVILLNSADSVINASDNPLEYNYRSKPVQIGLQGLQKVVVEVDIKPSQFIKTSIFILILSFLVVMIPLVLLFYFITIIRRRDKELQSREVSINGIIHDLKSPIVKIAMMLDLFRMIETDDSKRDMIIHNQKSILLLSSRIERLLSVAKDRIEIHKERVNDEDIKQRVTILTGDLQRHYNHKDIELNLFYEIENTINVDTMCFDSIIFNLVENSLKYSKDSVKIEVSLKQYNDQLKIIVSDNGIGIAKHNNKKIFKHLYRVDYNGANGNGIGLTYIRAIARAHGGDVVLKASELDKFSEFEATINIV